ncbi:MAG: hypothetical protein E7328_00285 [Clostridiales bacterium]|nr:hypothetical protein [Clostridiales bacterium]
MKGRVLLVLCLLFCLCGCSDGLELDDSAHVLSIAVDKGEEKDYRFTFQMPVLMGSEGTVGGEGARFRSISLEAENIMDAFESANHADARYMNFAHLNFFAVSEELARAGEMPELIASCAYFAELRDGAMVVVTEGKAEDFLKGFENEKESNLERLQENLISGAQTSAIIPDTTVADLMEYFTDGRGDAVVALGGVNEGASEGGGQEEGAPALAQNAMDDEIGETERSGGLGSELRGCALFSGGTMKGSFGAGDTRFLLMLRGEFQQMRYVLSDPANKDTLTLNVTRDGEPEITFEGEKPTITVRLRARVVDQSTFMDPDAPHVYEEIHTAAYNALYGQLVKVSDDVMALGADGWNLGRRLSLGKILWKNHGEEGLDRMPKKGVEVRLSMRLLKQDPYRR